jgi:hypothetical protein
VTDVFLGVIAGSVLVMAILQLAAAVVALRTARQVGSALGRIEENVRPIVANVQEISAKVNQISTDAARATAIATAQVERAAVVMDDVAQRVDETLTTVQDTILGPARSGMAIFQGLKAALGSFFERDRRPHRHGPSPDVGEDDASFIG